MIILKILLWIAVAVWVIVYAGIVVLSAMSVDEIFDTGGRIPSLDRILDRYRARYDYEVRLSFSTTCVVLGLFWPVFFLWCVLRSGSEVLFHRLFNKN